VAQLVKAGGTPLDSHWPKYFLRLCMSAARGGSCSVHSTSVTANDTINRARLQSTAADGNTLYGKQMLPKNYEAALHHDRVGEYSRFAAACCTLKKLFQISYRTVRDI